MTYEEVAQLAEQLSTEEQAALANHLQGLARQRQLDTEERLAVFASMIMDLGPIGPGFSLNREDWYGDER